MVWIEDLGYLGVCMVFYGVGFVICGMFFDWEGFNLESFLGWFVNLWFIYVIFFY